MTDKRTKIEALLATNATTIKKIDTDKQTKKTATGEQTETQIEEQRKIVTELFEQLNTKYEQDVQAVGEKYRQQHLIDETTLRQKDTEIERFNKLLAEKDGKTETTERQKTIASDQDPWHGQSPGPEVMQGMIKAKNKEIPMHTDIQTPDKDWSEILEDMVKDWIGHVEKTGQSAPEELIVQGRLVHNFREIVDEKVTKESGKQREIQIFTEQTQKLDTPDAQTRNYQTHIRHLTTFSALSVSLNQLSVLGGSSFMRSLILPLHASLWLYPNLPIGFLKCFCRSMAVHAGHPAVGPYLSIAFWRYVTCLVLL